MLPTLARRAVLALLLVYAFGVPPTPNYSRSKASQLMAPWMRPPILPLVTAHSRSCSLIYCRIPRLTAS